MNTDMTIIMFIATIEAVIIGLLVSDKLGLIKDTKVDDNPKDYKRNTGSTKCPSWQMKQSRRNKHSQNKNDHTTANKIGKSLNCLILFCHRIGIIWRQSTKCKQNHIKFSWEQYP